jgi:predicted ATPase
MIRRLRVRGYKSLRDTAIDFEPVSVIIGPNGVGKSNLLDLVGLMSRLVSRETVREAFDGHRGRVLEAFHSPDGFGPEAYSDLLVRDQLTFEVECDLQVNPRIVAEINQSLEGMEKLRGTAAPYTRVTETLLRYSLAVTLHPRTGELLITNESLRSLKKNLEPKADSVRSPFLEKKHDARGQERFVARVERQGHPRYFEPERPRTLLSELSDPVYHPHVVAAAREISSWRVYYVEPSRIREEVGVRAAQDPGRSGELLAPYFYFIQQKHPAVLSGINRNLQELLPGVGGLKVHVREGILDLVVVQQSGAEYPARLLSEGTLRLLCVIGISVAPAGPAVVGYEEPENGVNPARLELIARIVRNAAQVRSDGPQFLITTHSPLVCKLLPHHLVLCNWSKESESRFRVPDWRHDSLYFENEITAALDDETDDVTRRRRHHVAEPGG